MTPSDFAASFLQLRPRLTGFALRLTSSEEEAKDLVQETAALACANLHRFDGAYLKSWLCTIMRNTFINEHHRKKNRRKLGEALEAAVADKPPACNGAESALMTKELRAMLDQLQDDCRLPFEMHLLGYKYEEIADRFGLPLGTLKSRLFKARKHLQALVRFHYGSTDFRRA